MNNLIETGESAPLFALPDQNGTEHRLSDCLGSWVVLYFYPRDSTPGCTTEACDFRDAAEAFNAQNAIMLGVSPDPVASHARFATAKSLNFPLLCDGDHATCEAYGVWQQKINFGKTYMGVVRTTYLIDPQGKIAHRWDRVKVAGHVQSVLAQLMQRIQTQ